MKGGSGEWSLYCFRFFFAYGRSCHTVSASVKTDQGRRLSPMILSILLDVRSLTCR